MKVRRETLIAIAVSVLLASCATTGEEISQKDRDRMAREMEKANRRDAQSQSKMMRDTGQRRANR